MKDKEYDLDSLRVLIVNDDQVSTGIVDKLLISLGIKYIAIALNGYEAFEIIKRKQYDLVLCTLDMPIMNGYVCA